VIRRNSNRTHELYSMMSYNSTIPPAQSHRPSHLPGPATSTSTAPSTRPTTSSGAKPAAPPTTTTPGAPSSGPRPAAAATRPSCRPSPSPHRSRYSCWSWMVCTSLRALACGPKNAAKIAHVLLRWLNLLVAIGGPPVA
jgi:hypothetical protein